MTKPRFWAGCGVAAAAAVAISVVLFVPGGHNTVQAATIFRSLREATHRGLHMEVENLQVEGIAINARLQIAFPQPVTLVDLVDGHRVPDPEFVYIDAAINADPDHPDIGGLSLDAAMAFSQTDNWVFVRLHELPTKIVEEEPAAAAVFALFPALKTGMLLDLKGMGNVLGDVMDEANTEDEDDDADADMAAAEHKHISVRVGGNPADVDAVEVAMSVDQEDASQDPADAALEKLLHDFLSGSASREQIEQAVKEMEHMAKEVTVTEVRPGEWRLSAREFDMSEADSEEVELLAKAELNITYREGEGVQSCEVLHAGQADGTIRFSFIDQVDPTLASRERYTKLGVPVIDVSGILKMFEGMGQQD